MATSLPIDAVLGDVLSSLKADRRLVLQAPPGAGKTTRVPLYLMREGLCPGRILMLEPRRVAARTAALFMAKQLGETVGQTVGYRMRGETRVSRDTRIEVVTEGVLTRMLQSDPELSGIGCVIFDEFHERSLQADLGLALVWEVRAALRPDLHVLVMSATLDAAPVAALMDAAPIVTSDGESFPVTTHWLDKPWGRPGDRGRGFERAAVDLVTRVVAQTEGGVLVFLPGAGEIRRVDAALSLGAGVDVVPLYGALPFKAQLAALEPAPPGRRKVVLATAIAETSLTLPDVRVVVDCGRARRARFDANSGMTRLVTEKVSKAEAAQRRGRAGRVAEGVCYRMWTKGEEGGFAAFPPVEIEDNDLIGLTLELAQWGARDASGLAFLTEPPHGPFQEAQALLGAMGALDQGGAITAHGRSVAQMPLHPRLAHMVLRAQELGMGWTGAALAALLTRQRGPVGTVDCASLVEDIRRGDGQRVPLEEIRREMKRIGAEADRGDLSVGAVLSLAYPDRIGKRRAARGARLVLSSGKGAALPDEALFSDAEFLAVADLDGDLREAKVRLAAPLEAAELRALHPVRTDEVCHWDKRRQSVVAERQTRLGALVLEAVPIPDGGAETRAAMLDGVRAMGLAALPWSKATTGLCRRVEWARAHGADFADMSDAGLLGALEDWLGPFLEGVSSRAGLASVDLGSALDARLGWDAKQRLDRLAPVMFSAPTGTGVRIDYAGGQPKISVRLQELMGLKVHPVVGADKTPLLIELLSPAQRPIQTTADLPGFWASSYADVRKDMRGRYPKHHWPEDPAQAEATRRTKSRKS